jgi:hypothetical protein
MEHQMKYPSPVGNGVIKVLLAAFPDALAAYEALVAYFVKDSVMEDATGLSIYWPTPSYMYHSYVPMA